MGPNRPSNSIDTIVRTAQQQANVLTAWPGDIAQQISG